ncbi:MAG: ABC-type transporter, integral rane subunit [Gemmatimonadetes bacterium]|nr:ABC-type transporter, integral rane subunit [Gemmatimonadota bacterium]
MRLSRWTLLALALLLAIVAGVMLGTLRLSPSSVLHGLLGTGTDTQIAVVRALRLPRVLLAVLVGAGLGASGAALQGATRNGLAEPYLLGVSGGAAVGAVLAVVLHAPGPVVPLAGFAGALAAVAVTLVVARAAGGRGDPRVVLMAGVVVGAFANAAIMVALANVESNVVRGALWWMMGSAADASWTQVRALAVYVAVGVGALLMLGRAIDVLSLGEDTAAGMGVDVVRVSLGVYVAAALLAAGTVAAAGLVGFVGLLVPHLVRMAGARGHRAIIGAAALAGGTLVVLADLGARVATPPAELPLGAVTAILGVPFFLARLRRLA